MIYTHRSKAQFNGTLNPLSRYNSPYNPYRISSKYDYNKCVEIRSRYIMIKRCELYVHY